MPVQTKRTNYIIKKIYGQEVFNGSKKGFLRSVFSIKTNPVSGNHDLVILKRRISISKKITIASVIFMCFVILLGIYYYNTFWAQFQNVLAAEGEIDAHLQRRSNISTNLATMLLDYSRHEKSIFEDVVGSRPEMMMNEFKQKLGEAVDTAKQQNLPINDMLSRVFALAEQYPDLKLSQNFVKFSDAIVEIEKDLAVSRIKYNTLSNKYTTSLVTFPGVAFNVLYGFETKPYYQADADAKVFKPVDY
ncbi:MAG: LemA family protein [Deltaproteobacteria bacterium]|nr:LemA family protein [Deltaproteobacteria bacterium]